MHVQPVAAVAAVAVGAPTSAPAGIAADAVLLIHYDPPPPGGGCLGGDHASHNTMIRFDTLLRLIRPESVSFWRGDEPEMKREAGKRERVWLS